MSDAADKELVELAKNGDLDAFAELVQRYRERIYRTIFRFTQNHGDTDDLAQETFMRAFKAIRHFHQKSEFYTWIFRIAVNQSLNFLKKKKREMAKEEYQERRLDKQLSGGSSAESVSLNKELEARLQDAVKSLPPSYRSSFVLVVFQAMTHGEAARVLRCSESTVSWRMHKARKMLQARLRPYLDEARNEMPEI